MNILFFEVGQNLVWKNVLATIQKDISGFVEDGGWGTVLGESDEEGQEDEEAEAGDSEFSPDTQGVNYLLHTDPQDGDSESSDDDDIEGDDDFDEEEDDDDDELSDVLDLENLSDQEEDEEEEEEIPRKKTHQQKQ